MTITQRFTTIGIIGVLFVFLGPAISAYAYWRWFSALQQLMIQPIARPSGGLPILPMAVIGSFMTLASFPMMIIGREFSTASLGVTGRIEPSR